MNRRHFFFGALAAPTVLRASTKPGPNDRIRLGFIGLGGRGKWLLKNEEYPGADIVAFADCYRPHTAEATQIKPSLASCTQYQDYRRLLEKEKLDAVFIETTTHARVLIALQAIDAGLDVYAEKPLTLTVEEGQVLRAAVKAHGTVLQTGTQQRSIPINRWASEQIRKGAIGKVNTVITCNFEGPERWVAKPEQPMPDGLDWDLFCNQTELRPYHKDLQNRWAWYWDYDGGGQSWGVSGWGTHSLDQVQCALGTDDTGPVEFWMDEPGPTAPVTARYASGTILRMDGKRRDHADLGAIFKGEKGSIEIKRGSIVCDPPDLLKGAPADTPEGPGEDAFHIQNFLECMRTRKLPNAHVEAGHRATSLCHMVNMCRDLGRRLKWDPKAEKFQNDEEANRLLARTRRKGYELPRI
jgi:predicted dehydrogenase